MKILVTGSRGLVGKNVSNYLQKRNPKFKVITTNRSETDLFSFNETKKLLHDTKPNILVNCAAKVGGIYANNTKRTQFLLENLKINSNLLEATIGLEDIKIINLGSSCIYPLNAHYASDSTRAPGLPHRLRNRPSLACIRLMTP